MKNNNNKNEIIKNKANLIFKIRKFSFFLLFTASFDIWFFISIIFFPDKDKYFIIISIIPEIEDE